MKIFVPILAALALASAEADLRGHGGNHGRQGRNRFGGNVNVVRQGRQGGDAGVQGGIDFAGCQNDPETGLCCIEKTETVTSLQKDPILECTHKNVEKCHYTYVTQFESAQEEICEENFEKTCQITFKQQAFSESVKKCYKPLEKICQGTGPEECRTVYESSCTTRYIEKQPGKFVGDTSCEKLPVEICGAGCETREGPEECHDKEVTSLVDVPEEVCDLNPQKTCRFQTKLVPKLKPTPECTIIPQETCNLKFSSPTQVDTPLLTKWCRDDTPPSPDETYDENNARGSVLGAASEVQNSYSQPQAPRAPAPARPSAPRAPAPSRPQNPFSSSPSQGFGGGFGGGFTPAAPAAPATSFNSFSQPAQGGYSQPQQPQYSRRNF